MEYKAGDKFEIEIEETADCNLTAEKLYKIKGFNSLVFDQSGLDKLTKIEPKPIEEIKIGDTVEVINKELIYRFYEEWLEQNAPELVDRFEEWHAVPNGTTGIVMVQAPHEFGNVSLCAVLINGKIIIIGSGGIKKIND